jgi:tetratricopeptide (TPR) repeat protein
LAAIFLAGALAAYIFLWLVYGFRFNAGPHGAAIAIAAMPGTPWLRSLFSVLLDLHLFPQAWIDGQIFNLTHLTRTAYLLGRLSDTGFWSYFPVTFATKTPLPTLALLIAALYFIARRKIAGAAAFFLLTPATVYFILAVLSRLNIGLRHILQIYPFLFVLAGAAAAESWKRPRVMRPTVIVLGLWLVVEAAIIYPDHLAYFNEFAGGAKNGYRVAIDSNLDWGQDLKGLKRFLDERGIGKIYLSYFGTADPCFYNIDFIYITALPPRPEACAGGKPGIENADFLAVSATNRFLTRNSYEWLASYKPIAQVGYSIFVYDFRGDREAHKKLGVVYLKAGEIDEARREFAPAGEPMSDKMLARVDLGDDPRPYANLAETLFKKGLVAEAITMLEQASNLNPYDADAHTNLGGVYLMNNRLDRAIEEFDAALKINPASAEAHNNMGTAYLRKGRPDLAYPHYTEALRLKPDMPEAAGNLKLVKQALAAQPRKR